MNLYLRLLFTLIRSRLGASLGPLETGRAAYRVWPHDLDLSVHMNNGRYATLMDLGRVDLMVRAGAVGRLLKAGMSPVVTAQHITYRRSLLPFQRFHIETRVTGWDERSIYLEQRFVRGPDDEECARAVLQTLFLDKKGRVPSARIVELFGIEEHREPPREALALFPRPKAAAPEV